MTIDYHVHLEEGPYSSRWLERTSQALEFFNLWMLLHKVQRRR